MTVHRGSGQPRDPADPGGGELGAALPGQRLRSRATRPPVDPRLLRLHPAVRRHLVLTTLLSLVTAAALIAQASALAAIIARTFLDGAVLSEHTPWLLLLATAVAVRAGAAWASDVLGQRTAAQVKSTLRQRVLHRLTGCPPGELPGTTGALASTLTDGIDALDGTFGGYLPALVAGAVIPLALVGWVLPVDPISGAVLAVTLPLIPVFMVLIGLAARASTRARFRALTELSGHLLGVLQGLPTIRVSRASARVGRAVRDAAERLRCTTMATLRVAFLSALILELLAALAVATVAVVAGVRLAEGTGLTLEPALVALLLAPEAFWPLRRIGQQFHANEEGAAAAERLLDLLGDDADDAGRGRRPAPDPSRNPIHLVDVTVQYPDRPLPALDRIDLEVPAGEWTAIVGASGAGKTTLANVLLGLRVPDRGAVSVGGVALVDLDPEAWHGRIAWVPQQPASLRGTVRELATLGSGTAPPSEAGVWAALRSVALDEEVRALPDGLDTLIGPGGQGLSAGQRRRLALARALLRPARLLVLDEPTSDLDVEAERAVRTVLAGLRGRRTVVVLTHRVALAADAEHVVVLDDGRVAEQGAPADLATGDGAFARLVAASRPLAVADLLPGAVTSTVGPTHSAGDEDRGSDETAEEPPVTVGAGAVGALRSLVGPHRRRVAAAATAGAVTPLAGTLLVIVSTYLISAAALRPNLLDLTVAIVGVRALSLLKGVSRYLERLAGHDVALRVVRDLRCHVYAGLVPQAPAGLARHRVGDVLARVVSDVERLQLALVRGTVPLLGGGFACLGLVIVTAWLLPAATPIVASGLLVVGLGVPLFTWRVSRTPEARLAAARGTLAAGIVDALQAAPELRLLGRRRAVADALVEADAVVVRHDRSAVSRGGGADALIQLGLGATLLGLIVVGVPAVSAGDLDGVLLGALLVLALAAGEAVGPLPAATRALATAGNAARRLGEVLDTDVPAPDPERPIPARGGALAFQRVTARYPGGVEPAVAQVDLTVAPGHTVAVVGRSGAGKSTVGGLAVRFLDPDGGEVRLGVLPATSITGDDLRRWVTLTPQDGQVLQGTVAANLRLAAPEATEAELWQALAAAQLDRWVAGLPDGLRTPLGDQGSRLSGGQRHRLALARTLLVGAPVVVLDEPTADLDAVTGRAFLRDILRAVRGRGLVLLTHDLRPLPVVDEVVVLEAGRVVARGSHRDLLATDRAYQRRWELDRVPVA